MKNTYKKAPCIIEGIVDNTTILFNSQNGKLFELNEIGGLIWGLFNETDLIDQQLVWEALKHYFDLENKDREGVRFFFAELVEKGMITQVNEKRSKMAGVIFKLYSALLERQPFVAFTYRGASMSSVFKEGQKIIVYKPPQYSFVKEGDTIAFLSGDHELLIIHRVLKIYDDDGIVSFLTKGDDREDADYPVSLDRFLGIGITGKTISTEKPVVHENIILRQEDGYEILYNYDTMDMFVLNSIGTLVTKRCDGTNNLYDIVYDIYDEFEEVDIAVLLNDVEDFILKMKEKGIIEYV